ncbi:hypothetical protein SLEP1_g41193 [Rubroshorea leprosula]|uniref:Uncharacterized protein n=1 Tax=Rubroshorea leprosula TaxID=152421 RepID=A0AAV5L5V5_9ROSI|nr:hypothetical protein SLEP1_g41193 [Rubroshorea leprosula]
MFGSSSNDTIQIGPPTKSEEGKLHNVIHTVNYVHGWNHRYPNSYFGNIISERGATEPSPFLDTENGFALAETLNKVRDAIRKVNADSVLKKLQETIFGHSTSVMKRRCDELSLQISGEGPSYQLD